MAEIRVLPQDVADKIAAGEVAERPAAVVKELVENSIDAGADQITVEIQSGGMKYIRIEDNGSGIPSGEVEFAFVRHATSKLREIDDLFRIGTMGFRGEALASICAVADVEVITKTRSQEEGTYMVLSHGEAIKKESIACNQGTVMVVQNLFASVPARMKFMKKDATEAGYVEDVLGRIALSRPDIAFRYICDGKEIFSTSGDGQLKNTILNIYGIGHAKGIIEVNHSEHGVKVYGVVGKAELAKGNRKAQTLFVNGRYIKNHVVSKVVEEAYRNILMTGRFPFFVLNIDLAPELVDVNVHPAKTEIKFANEKEIYEIAYRGVKNALYMREQEQKNEETSFPVGEIQPAIKKYEYENKALKIDEQKQIADFLANTVPEKTEKTGFYFRSPSFESMPKEEKQYQMPEQLPEEEKIVEEKVFSKIVGQVFDTYVIVEKNNEMFMIDQHAAHERKRFEGLRRDYLEKRAFGQVLLVPIVMEIDSADRQIIDDNSKMLESMGFKVEEFGGNSVIIRETPIMADDVEIKALLLEIIAILGEGRQSGLLSFEERMLDSISCKYAIKANKRLSIAEMEKLIEDVEELESQGITTCPHGRPIKISFTKREIEKMFKRIV